jgi:putative peptide zinc metalloprotease protein
MATTLPPSARAEAPARGALDRAEGVELLGPVDGSGYREGACLVRRADGQMLQLGPLMYALLDEVDGRRNTADLASALCERLGRACDEEHVEALAQKLAARGLLAGSEANAPPRANPLLALRFKVLVTNPRTTAWLTAPLTPLFRPWVLWPVVAGFLAVCWYVLVEKGMAPAVASGFRSPELFVLVFALAVASAGFHELGHAAACRYGGATPRGMGMGVYMVWPAFYTDVTDSYRLPRRARLRVDLGGIYFNAIVSVATFGVWLLWREDALLLLIALQLLMIVKNLSPVFRSDGYHILADATGVPDLYAHLGPTLRRLVPWRREEPSALRGRARALVTAWVLVVVPVLLGLLAGAVLVLPRLLASTWESGRTIGSALGDDLAGGRWIDATAAALKLLALALPLLGATLVVQMIARRTVRGSLAWAGDRPLRRGALAVAATAACCGTAWALWPSGQYRPVRPADGGTLVAFRTALASPRSVARPQAQPAPVHVAPGTHLALALVPVGGATERHPAVFVLRGEDGDDPVALLSTDAPDADVSLADTQENGVPTAPTATTTTSTVQQQSAASSTAPESRAVAFPFTLPSKPGPGGTQALAVNTTDGAVLYTVAYALVTIRDGADVTNTNSAFAIASCKGCTTVAASFQVVLIVGRSRVIAPINAAGAVNYDCPACVTTAIADQLVVTLKSEPTDDLVAKIQTALKRLDALPTLGADATPTAVAAVVHDVQKQIDTALEESGQLAKPPATSTTTATATATTTRAATSTRAATTTSTAPAATTSATTTTTATRTTTAATTTTAPATTSTTTAATTTSATTTTTTTTTAPTTTTATTTTTGSTTTTTGG